MKANKQFETKLENMEARKHANKEQYLKKVKANMERKSVALLLATKKQEIR